MPLRKMIWNLGLSPSLCLMQSRLFCAFMEPPSSSFWVFLCCFLVSDSLSPGSPVFPLTCSSKSDGSFLWKGTRTVLLFAWLPGRWKISEVRPHAWLIHSCCNRLNISLHTYPKSDTTKQTDAIQFVVPISGRETVTPYFLLVPTHRDILFPPGSLRQGLTLALSSKLSSLGNYFIP